MQLRDYQEANRAAIYNAWDAGHRNVLDVLPTGGGKTVILARVAKDHHLRVAPKILGVLIDHGGPVCIIAHRQELVSQISVALAREGIYHRIVGPSKVVRFCNKRMVRAVGRSYYDAGASVGVAGVDTLVRYTDPWLSRVTLWIQDEAHHIQKGNKWGKAAVMMPNAKGLGVTATPERADGRGLSRETDGLFDTMVVGPSMRELINRGFLTDYKIYAPQSDIDMSRVDISSATGDFNQVQLRKACKGSKITGDIVKEYLKIAPGKLGITFVPSVEIAEQVAREFNAAGVPALAVSANTPDSERADATDRFERREIMQLVNVDLFGEGYDLPSIEVCSFGRHTASYGLYVQQFGRALRLLEGKKHAIIIDHVGNVIKHGLPDAVRTWSLDRRERRTSTKSDDAIPLRSCPDCTAVYERIRRECPECGSAPVPVARSGPEFVDGDLHELDAETLARMRGDIQAVDKDPEEHRVDLIRKHVPYLGQLAGVKRFAANQQSQEMLRETIAWWGAFQRQAGLPDYQSYRLFYYRFGVDVMTAQTLKKKEADALNLKITGVLYGT